MFYLKKLLLSLKEIFLVMIIQYILLISIILLLGMDKAIIYGSIVLSLFELFFIIWKSKNINFKFTESAYFAYMILGIGIATIYNMVIFKLDLNKEATVDFPIILNLICSGIIGPIFEEILFRHNLTLKLEKINNNKFTTIILAGIVFGLCHTGIVTIIYATTIGIVNTYIYIKDKDIIKPIILHISGNIFVNLLYGYNSVILILGIILIIIGLLIIKRDN